MNPVYLISSVHTSEFGNEPFIQTPSLYRWGNWGVPTARVGETWIREPACQGSWEWGVEDPVPNLFSLLRVPYCGQRGEGESGAGLNSDGFLTQHTVTCSEVRLLWGHKRDILPVLNVQFEQHWMPFKMHFTPRHGSSTDFSYCMGEVWKETDMCALQTGDHAQKPFLNLLYWNLEHLYKSGHPILLGLAVTHPKGAWWRPGAQTVNALRPMFLLLPAGFAFPGDRLSPVIQEGPDLCFPFSFEGGRLFPSTLHRGSLWDSQLLWAQREGYVVVMI